MWWRGKPHPVKRLQQAFSFLAIGSNCVISLLVRRCQCGWVVGELQRFGALAIQGARRNIIWQPEKKQIIQNNLAKRSTNSKLFGNLHLFLVLAWNS